MELALNILGLLACGALCVAVLRSVMSHGRNYVACFAILLVCVSLIFPAISMTDDLAMGALLSHDPILPQLKFWQLAVQLALFAALLLAAVALSLLRQNGVQRDDSPLAVSVGFHFANPLRAPPTSLA